MANNDSFPARFRAAMRDAARKFLAEEALPEPVAGEAKFTTIENLALAAGDAVSLEVFEQQLELQREQHVLARDESGLSVDDDQRGLVLGPLPATAAVVGGSPARAENGAGNQGF
jgi:hypothetical protein